MNRLCSRFGGVFVGAEASTGGATGTWLGTIGGDEIAGSDTSGRFEDATMGGESNASLKEIVA